MQGTDTVLRMAVKDSLDASVGSVAGDARQQLWKRTSTDSPTVGHILECCHRRGQGARAGGEEGPPCSGPLVHCQARMRGLAMVEQLLVALRE
jgi:hypothetical protein